MQSRLGHNRTYDLIETIRERVSSYNDSVIIAEQATQEAQLNALAAIYELDNWFQEYPEERAAFYGSKNIKVDPRAKHESQPLVKHFIVSGELTKSLRNRVTLWSGAITEAHRQNVASENFVEFIQKTPEGILGAYMAANRALKNKEARGDLVDKFNIAEKKYNQEFIVADILGFENIHTLPAGKKLAVIEVSEKGNAVRHHGFMDR